MLYQSGGALIAGGIYTVLLAIAAISEFRNTIRRKPASLLVPRSALVAANERAMPYGVALVVGALAAGWLSSTF